jgi:hypothetical protein
MKTASLAQENPAEETGTGTRQVAMTTTDRLARCPYLRGRPVGVASPPMGSNTTDRPIVEATVGMRTRNTR